MDRRKFVQSALLSGPLLTGLLPSENAPAMSSKDQEWYELRTYLFANDAQRRLTGAYLEQAYLPALNRAGIENIGVFSEWQPQATGKMFLLIPFKSIGSFTAINGKLAHDEVYLRAGEAYLSPDPAHPAYERIESSLLKAFVQMPRIELPDKKPRLFELRCYESPGEAAGQKKIEMFNDAGEIAVFKKIGARPVFFGETIIGLRRPNLTYMLCFDDMAAHDARWKAFGSDPEWKKISAMPEYADARLISKITRTFLEPAVYSQI
ncbi:NIPSNAP family protein [Flavitalea sp. BT771]|uniref:NIPSNAP family protein n=1 Tax=Flavitalea sp. BT771 TaxID=3063329 RepID=UPI0026E1B086|nr:NIPSNAP family protein [Flavitalea sp. BT771]MDO6431706.1 NIPSNAP family protein [Flavitalea sp. BT771]MDV6220614.1 NIPSNAP family protein [Flavitalea sp. BT771]